MEDPNAKDSASTHVLDNGSSSNDSQLQVDDAHKVSKPSLDVGVSDSDNIDCGIMEKASSPTEFSTSNGIEAVTASANEALHLLEEKPVMPYLEPVSNELTDIFEETDDGQTSSENFPLSEENSQLDSEKVSDKDTGKEVESNLDSISAVNSDSFDVKSASISENSFSVSEIEQKCGITDVVPGEETSGVVTISAEESNITESKDAADENIEPKFVDHGMEDQDLDTGTKLSHDTEKEAMKETVDNLDDSDTVLLIGDEENHLSLEQDEKSTESVAKDMESDEMEAVACSVQDKVEEQQGCSDTSKDHDVHEMEESQITNTKSSTGLEPQIEETDEQDSDQEKGITISQVDSVKEIENSPGPSVEHSDLQEQKNAEELIKISTEPGIVEKNATEQETSLDSNDLSFTITNVSGGETIFATSTETTEDSNQEITKSPAVSISESITSEKWKMEDCKGDSEILTTTDAGDKKENEDGLKGTVDNSAMDIEASTVNEEGMDVDITDSLENQTVVVDTDKLESETDVTTEEKRLDGKDGEDEENMEVDETENDKSVDKIDEMEKSTGSAEVAEHDEEKNGQNVTSERESVETSVSENVSLSTENKMEAVEVKNEKEDESVVTQTKEEESEKIDNKEPVASSDKIEAPDTNVESEILNEKDAEKDSVDGEKIKPETEMKEETSLDKNEEVSDEKIKEKDGENKEEVSSKKEDDKGKEQKKDVESDDDDIAIISDEPAKKPVDQQPDVKTDENDMGLQISAVSGGVDMGEAIQKVQADTTTPDVKPEGKKKKRPTATLR